MTKNIIFVLFNCMLILGLAIINGCATKMDTRKLPDNMEFGPANKQGYKRILAITYSHPMPQMTESEYLDRMIECVDESVFYEEIWTDGSPIAIRKDAEQTYTGAKRDLVKSSDVIIGVYPVNNSIRAAGITTFPVGPGTAIVRFSLTAEFGKSNDYVLRFDSIEIALRELLKTKGFIRATNNAYQHPERIYEKTRLMSEAINVCLTADQSTQQVPDAGNYDSPAIVNELLAKAMQLDSYALDYIAEGVTIKRMYFQMQVPDDMFVLPDRTTIIDQ